MSSMKIRCAARKTNLPYNVIICHKLMKELQMDVIYSENVVVWDGVILPMQKIHNVKCIELKSMDQEDEEAIKKQSIRLGRINNANYKNNGLEQEVHKIIYLTKFQLIILLSCLKP